MLSVLTNTSAMSALRAFGATQAALATAQRQVTTGRRVGGASDDAAYWSIATTMTSRVGELKAVNDGLDLTASIIASTTAALTNILAMTQRMAGLVVAMQSAGIDASASQSQITGLQAGILSTAQSASFDGVNWLVTRVVGTSTTAQTSNVDATYDYDQGIRAHAMDGVDHDDATYAVAEDVTRTLASTSSSHDDETSSARFTLTGTTTDGVHSSTIAASNQTQGAHATGDPTGYRVGRIPMSIGSDGSVLSSTEDFHVTELFQSFSGTSSTGLQETFTDRTITSSTSVQQASQTPYITGAQDDVLDTPFLTSKGLTNILQMELTGAGDAALAAPAIDAAIAGITKAMTFLGGLQEEVDGSRQLNTALIDTLTSGVGSLVDADMDETSTRLAALQAQVRLATQSLAVANNDGGIILQLFAGGDPRENN